MSESKSGQFVSRGGQKLARALDHFNIDVAGLVCADLGSHVGGFVDCLLQRGAARVFSVDTSYGTLAWTLRRDDRVVVLERTNAMHVTLPKPVDLVTIDVGWTPQARILPSAAGLLKRPGSVEMGEGVTDPPRVLTLIKPHYEAPKDQLDGGVLPNESVEGVTARVIQEIEGTGWHVLGSVESPIRGHGGNREFMALLELRTC